MSQHHFRSHNFCLQKRTSKSDLVTYFFQKIFFVSILRALNDSSIFHKTVKNNVLGH